MLGHRTSVDAERFSGTTAWLSGFLCFGFLRLLLLVRLLRLLVRCSSSSLTTVL